MHTLVESAFPIQQLVIALTASRGEQRNKQRLHGGRAPWLSLIMRAVVQAWRSGEQAALGGTAHMAVEAPAHGDYCSNTLLHRARKCSAEFQLPPGLVHAAQLHCQLLWPSHNRFPFLALTQQDVSVPALNFKHFPSPKQDWIE